MKLIQHIYRGIAADSPGGRAGIANPERGFRFENRIALLPDEFPVEIYRNDFTAMLDAREADVNWILPFQEFRHDGVTVVQAYCYLVRYCDGPIAEEKIRALEHSFAAARRHGVKFLLRFAYEGIADNFKVGPTVERTLAHMEQLRPVLERNADVIYLHQLGWVGAWGEWHNSADRINREIGKSKQIVAKALEITPPDIPLQMRCYRYRRDNLEALGCMEALDGEARRSGRPAGRIGFFNDATLADEQDCGTFPEAPYAAPGNWEFDRVTAEAPFMPVDGELFWSDSESRTPDALIAAKRLTLHCYTTFSMVHGYSRLDKIRDLAWSIDDWRKFPFSRELVEANGLPAADRYFENLDGTSCRRSGFEYIRDHLGYRLELRRGAWPEAPGAGEPFALELELVNRGFAAPVKVRRMEALLTDGTGNTAACWELCGDLRDLQPGIHCLRGAVAAPEPGRYRLGIRMADPRSPERGEYAIRFANEEIEFTGGVNEIGSVEVHG